MTIVFDTAFENLTLLRKARC